MRLPKVVIVGAGPAGLMTAYLLKDIAEVTLVDQKKAPGRKFLVAGDGGLNLTHSEELDLFLSRYSSDVARNWVRKFPPNELIRWFSDLGIPTRTGSSGKIFPEKRFKPIEVLNAILQQLNCANINWKLGCKFLNFEEKQVFFEGDSAELTYDFLVFALGGASWKRTGSDGSWQVILAEKGIEVQAFGSSNAGIVLSDEAFCREFDGAIIKNVTVRTPETVTAGDIRVTNYGLEGKPIYAANRAARQDEKIFIDFKPQLDTEKIAGVLQKGNVRNGFNELRIPDVVYSWIKNTVSREIFIAPDQLAGIVKSFPLIYSGLGTLEEAISTVGGVCLTEIEPSGRLKKMAKVYCAGEMLDWDAPTGGYLLQACFSSGYSVGKEIADRIGAPTH